MTQACPFESDVLPTPGTNEPDPEKQSHQSNILDSVPASYLDHEHNLQIACPDTSFFARELDLSRLHRVMQWLWLCGRCVPARPLHQQLLLERNIVLAEALDLHLVWGKGKIFLKPLPRWLIQRTTWTRYLHESTKPKAPSNGSLQTIESSALGFLLSYVALIRYESDFLIAKEHKLLPQEIKWAQWKSLVHQILRNGRHHQSQVADRFIYGELRLSRLNLMYQVLFISHLGYQRRWNSYRRFVGNNLDFIVSTTVYLALILTALQVGLSVPKLESNDTFRAAAYGATVLAMLGPLVAMTIVLIFSGVNFWMNWAWNRRFEKQREGILRRHWTGSSDIHRLGAL